MNSKNYGVSQTRTRVIFIGIRNDITEKVGLNFMTIQNVFPEPSDKVIPLKEALEAERIYKKVGDLKEIRRIQVRIQEKFTLPCACLVFGLIGSTLGSKSSLRSSKSQGFGLSVILILIYYVMSFVFSSFGVKGLIPPIIAAWFPVFISLSGGFYFLKKSNS